MWSFFSHSLAPPPCNTLFQKPSFKSICKMWSLNYLLQSPLDDSGTFWCYKLICQGFKPQGTGLCMATEGVESSPGPPSPVRLLLQLLQLTGHGNILLWALASFLPFLPPLQEFRSVILWSLPTLSGRNSLCYGRAEGVSIRSLHCGDRFFHEASTQLVPYSALGHNKNPVFLGPSAFMEKEKNLTQTPKYIFLKIKQ